MRQDTLSLNPCSIQQGKLQLYQRTKLVQSDNWSEVFDSVACFVGCLERYSVFRGSDYYWLGFLQSSFLLNSIISEHPQRPLFILWYDMSQDETFNFFMAKSIFIDLHCKWCQCRKSRQCCSVCDRKELIDGGPTTFLYYSTSGKF